MIPIFIYFYRFLKFVLTLYLEKLIFEPYISIIINLENNVVNR
ncbi:hypothetical protein P689_122204 [Candidatus Riesia pediculischaeffi PTSU]|uniref:Uncharacterized protein n=1 Tax=Candidatus Riesia pediculischaeffi PTSU TaxID=1401651 RepID=A0A0C1VJJ7_9ENTR|nr:hypothetical protein P689_122204 [Candidatus Riesia pediculischaeffi PTSU]